MVPAPPPPPPVPPTPPGEGGDAPLSANSALERDPHPRSPAAPGRSPSEIADAGPFPPVDGVLDRALALVEYLRVHCPWDRAQTAESLVPHLVEETHETVEAIHGGDPDALRDELGDLLLNLAFQVVVGEEAGRFHREGVVRGLEEKMIRRHPHLFGLGEKQSWEAIKARERKERDRTERERAEPDRPVRDGEEGPPERRPVGILDDLARGLDPLLRAHRIQERVAGVGFDWEDPRGALEKVREEVAEVAEALEAGDRDRLAEEMGDLLFSVVNVARLAGTHAIPALASANAKFQRRFQALEARARAEGISLQESSLEELDRLWDAVKEEERTGS
jgi:nucleoside triphosphate diphosphatase